MVFLLAALVCALFLAACIDPVREDLPKGTGSITINLGGSARSSFLPNEGDTFQHQITIEGPGGTFTSPWITIFPAPGNSYTFDNLTIGDKYIVVVEARSNVLDQNYTSPSPFPAPTDPNLRDYLRARGEGIATVSAAGGSSVPIIMEPATEIADFAQLNQAFINLSAKETFVITNGFLINSSFTIGSSGISQELTIISNAVTSANLTRDSMFFNEFFNVSSDGTLNLGTDLTPANLGLNGGGIVLTAPLIRLNGGTLNMYSSASIANNINDTPLLAGISDGSGGGVSLYNGASFNMYGGEIHDNGAFIGAGVYIHDGDFLMEGNCIIDYNASGGSYSGTEFAVAGGGGVYVLQGSFTLNGGLISSNIANLGGGVYVAGYGTFNKNGGVIHGSDGGIKANFASGNATWPSTDAPGNGMAVFVSETIATTDYFLGSITIPRGGKLMDVTSQAANILDSTSNSNWEATWP